MSAEAETKVEGQSPVPQASTEDAASPASPMQQDAALASDDARIENQMEIEQENSKQPESEPGQVGEDSETTRYLPVPAQVLQNVKDLKDEILSGQHPTVQAPEGGPDADEEENEERVDVVLKSFEAKREEEDGQEGQAQRDAADSDQEAKTGNKRDAESMLITEEDAPDPQDVGVAKGQAHEAPERDAKRARHEQDQGAHKRASNQREKTAADASFRKPSVSDSRASRGDLHASGSGLSRSGSRTYTENSQTRPSTYNDRYLGPDARGGRSYASDRNSISNRSAATSHTDRLSTDSSRRDHERDRVQESRSHRDSAYERGGPPPSNGRDYRRPDRDGDDRRVSSGPPVPTDRDVKPALRDRISGAPPLRRPSPPVSAASNGATRYSKPPQHKPELYGDRPADDRRTGYKDRAPPGQRERYPSSGAPAGSVPGYDRREVARTSSMPERMSDPRSFPPKNSTSYSEIRGLPDPRPPYPEQARKSPPLDSRYTKPSSTYRDNEPHRSNPNVTYSRPPVPRDSLGPPPPRGSSPPPRRAYEAPAGTAPSVSSGRTYGYGPNSTVPSQSYAAGRPEFDRYAAGGPPGDVYRERERPAEYRAPPAAAPSPDRYYPTSVAPPPAVDPYARTSYERQPPQYDRYGRPIPLEQGLPPTYASPARSAAPYIAPPVAASSVLDAELLDLKARMAELERRREAEKMVAVAVPPPRSYPNGPPELSYGGGPRGGMTSDRGYPPRERVREREREPASLYPPRNGPLPGNARDSAYGPPRNGPNDLPPPRNMPMHRGPARRSPPPLGRDDRSRR